jgi:hypothetical protein
MHTSSRDKMRLFVEQYLGARRGEPLVIHDLGSQDVNGSYRELFDSPRWRYTGLDMVPGDNVDLVLKTPYAWREVASGSVDVLVSGQAFEHIRYVWITMLEVARVLKPGGLCIVIAPSSGPEHRYPVDCWRFYPDGMESLARFAQLDILQVATQWQDEGHADGSDVWHDSVLICRKPDHGPWWNFKSALKRWLQHRSLVQGLSEAPPHSAPASVHVERPSLVAQPATGAPPTLSQCRFYHSVDLPNGESVKGEWDLRPTVAAYLGGVDFAGRSVLEVGPASGFLSFHMEAAGAQVTALEPPMEHLWDVAPMPGFDVAGWRREFACVITGVRQSFQYPRLPCPADRGASGRPARIGGAVRHRPAGIGAAALPFAVLGHGTAGAPCQRHPHRHRGVRRQPRGSAGLPPAGQPRYPTGGHLVGTDARFCHPVAGSAGISRRAAQRPPPEARNRRRHDPDVHRRGTARLGAAAPGTQEPRCTIQTPAC